MDSDMSRANPKSANASLVVPRRLLLNYMEEAQALLARRREIVGDRIRNAREKKGWLQKELARRVHVEPQTVSNWERGVTTPDLDKLEALGRELDHPVSYFLLSPEEEKVGDSASAAEIQRLRERVEDVHAEVREVRGLVERLLEDPPQASPRRRQGR